MTARFDRDIAVVIGIDDYAHVRPLTTAVADASRLAATLVDEHGYGQVYTLTSDAEPVTKERLTSLFTEELPDTVGSNDRLLIYFAGHGIALNGDDGPQGYLIPQDARTDDRDSFIAMGDFYGWVNELACRHLLLVLDCCFAGAFTWYGRRDLFVVPEQLYQEHYDRFLREPAWQILTSAAYDQEALDVLDGKALGARGESVDDGSHSPFARAFFEALAGAGDLIPRGEGDGVVTATELYLYLRNYVELQAEDLADHYQTPELWPFSREKHGKGEYIFLVPGHGELALAPAPALNEANNPYVGLRSYNAVDAKLFFGREPLIEALIERVDLQPLTVVLGASGTGKSSLVKAGLVPHLSERADSHDFLVLPPMRPGDAPIQTLTDLLRANLPWCARLPESSEPRATIDAWCEAHPEQRLLLIVDQLEELVTLCQDGARESFLACLAALVEAHPDQLHLVLTLRTDFEPQFNDTPLSGLWQAGRFFVPPMNQAELREVIEEPAAARLFFDPPQLVDELIDEVLLTPGALPLLSFTLSELYLKYLKRQEDAQLAGETLDRTLIQHDYDELGGVIGSLRRRADEVYADLPDDAHRETMERVMLRMVAVEGGELARRRVPSSELIYPSNAENERVRTVVARLVEARLLVIDSIDANGDGEADAYIEPAHDALIRAWDRLLRWKQAFEEYLSLQRRLTAAANEWELEGSDPKSGLLWNNNPRLLQLQAILSPESNGNGSSFVHTARQSLWPSTEITDKPTWLNRVDTDFVQSSVVRRANVFKRIAVIAAAVFIVMSALTTFAFDQQQEAVTQRDSAVHAQATAEAESAARATEVVVRSTAEAVAIEQEAQAIAAGETAVAEANARATQVVIAEEEKSRADHNAEEAQSNQFAAQAQAMLNTGDSASAPALYYAKEAVTTALQRGDIVTVDADAALRRSVEQVYWRTVLPRHRHTQAVTDVAVTSDDAWIVSASEDKTIRVWNRQTGEQILSLSGDDEGVESIDISPDDLRLVSAGGDSAVRLWDLHSGEQTHTLQAHEGAVRAVAFSPDGDEIVSAGDDAKVLLWDSTSGELVKTLRGHQGPIYAAAYSPDGALVASAGADGTVRLWQRSSGQVIANLIDPDRDLAGFPIHALAFGPDSRLLASAGDSAKVNLWDVASGELVKQFPGHNSRVVTLAFSPDGRRLVRGSDSRNVKIWDVEDGVELLNYAGHARPDDNVTSAVFIAGGEMVVSGGQNGKIYLWNSITGETIHTFGGHAETVLDVAYSPDGQLIASGSKDKTTKVWDAESGQELFMLRGHGDNVESLSFSPDGTHLATGSEDATIRVWDLASRSEIRRFTDYAIDVRAVAYSSDGDWLAAGAEDGIVRIWDVNSGSLERILSAHPEGVQGVAFGADDRLLASVDRAGNLFLWDIQNGTDHVELEGNEGRLRAVSFSPDGSMVAAGGDDQVVYVWNTETLLPFRMFQGHSAAIRALDFSPDGRLLSSGGSDETIRLWDVETGEAIRTLRGHTDYVNSVNFSPDGNTLVSAAGGGSSGNYSIRIWNVKPLAERNLIEGHDGIVRWATFSPDGKLLITAGDDRMIRVWDAESSELIRELSHHTNRVRTIDFSSDGASFISASDDGTIGVWNTRTLTQTGQLVGHQGWVRSAFFSPDDALIVSASEDGSVRLWDAKTGEEVRKLLEQEEIATYASFSPDGRQIAGAAFDGTVRIWNTDSGVELHRVEIPSEFNNVVEFSADGTMLAIGYGDAGQHHGVQIRDAETMESIQEIAYGGPVRTVAFSANGEYLLIGGPTGTVDLHRFSADGADSVLWRRVGAHAGPIWSVSFSPDGRFFVSAGEDEKVRISFTEIDELVEIASSLISIDPPVFRTERRSSLLQD